MIFLGRFANIGALKGAFMKKFFVSLFLVFVCGVSFAGVISGSYRVVDGDTIEVNGEKVRLLCVDTPESKFRGRAQYCLDGETNCGELATGALIGFFGGVEKVECHYSKKDMYGRILGVCYGENYLLSYNELLLKNGFAYYYPCKEHKTWKKYQEDAQKSKVGLFSDDLGGFMEPKQWRKNGGYNK